jgi:hypothetical protein
MFYFLAFVTTLETATCSVHRIILFLFPKMSVKECLVWNYAHAVVPILLLHHLSAHFVHLLYLNVKSISVWGRRTYLKNLSSTVVSSFYSRVMYHTEVKVTLGHAFIRLYLRPIRNLGATWGWFVSANPRPLYPQERISVSLVQEAGRDPGPVRMGTDNFVPTETRSPHSPCSNELLYRLL